VSTSRVLFERDGAAAFLTFNRPEARNAMTWDMYDALVSACDAVDADDRVRVLVLRGAGGQAFVSGTDIGQFTSFVTRADVLGYEARLDAVIDRLERVRVATLAQIEGVAAGGGCVIALACDLRVCTPESRIGVPIARTLGNCLSAANCGRLLDLAGPAAAKELLFTGRLVDGAEALALRLVNRVVGAAAIDATVRELAATIAANAPLTIRATKETVRRIQASRRLAPDAVEDLITMCYLSEDFRGAVRAFLDKRAPTFSGR
jgi:enoyl-CoA hydratase/carnithine racemase